MTGLKRLVLTLRTAPHRYRSHRAHDVQAEEQVGHQDSLRYPALLGQEPREEVVSALKRRMFLFLLFLRDASGILPALYQPDPGVLSIFPAMYEAKNWRVA